MKLTDFFDTYEDYSELIEPKAVALAKEYRLVTKQVKRQFKYIATIKDEYLQHFMLRWFQLGTLYQRLLDIRKELKKIKFSYMLAQVQFKKKDPKEFKPLAIEQAKQIKVETILDEITKRVFHDTYLCPLHNEKSGSLKVYRNNNTWYCFGCCKGGSVIDLVMKHYDMSLSDAVTWLVGGLG